MAIPMVMAVCWDKVLEALGGTLKIDPFSNCPLQWRWEVVRKNTVHWDGRVISHLFVHCCSVKFMQNCWNKNRAPHSICLTPGSDSRVGFDIETWPRSPFASCYSAFIQRQSQSKNPSFNALHFCRVLLRDVPCFFWRSNTCYAIYKSLYLYGAVRKMWFF